MKGRIPWTEKADAVVLDTSLSPWKRARKLTYLLHRPIKAETVSSRRLSIIDEAECAWRSAQAKVRAKDAEARRRLGLDLLEAVKNPQGLTYGEASAMRLPLVRTSTAGRDDRLGPV